MLKKGFIPLSRDCLGIEPFLLTNRGEKDNLNADRCKLFAFKEC